MAKPTNKPANKPTAQSATKEAPAAKGKTAAAAVANPAIVEAIKAEAEASEHAQSALANLCEIWTESQCTRAELVASFMEARGVVKATAESQASRIIGLCRNPDVVADLKSGAMTLKAARNATKKTQEKSPDQEKASAQKRVASAISSLVNAAKESGMDAATVSGLVKTALKTAGVK